MKVTGRLLVPEEADVLPVFLWLNNALWIRFTSTTDEEVEEEDAWETVPPRDEEPSALDPVELLDTSFLNLKINLSVKFSIKYSKIWN